MKYFSGKYERIRAKFLRTPKNLPAPIPMICGTKNDRMAADANSMLFLVAIIAKPQFICCNFFSCSRVIATIRSGSKMCVATFVYLLVFSHHCDVLSTNWSDFTVTSPWVHRDLKIER